MAKGEDLFPLGVYWAGLAPDCGVEQAPGTLEKNHYDFMWATISDAKAAKSF